MTTIWKVFVFCMLFGLVVVFGLLLYSELWQFHLQLSMFGLNITKLIRVNISAQVTKDRFLIYTTLAPTTHVVAKPSIGHLHPSSTVLPPPLLTLFTSFKNTPDRLNVESNTVYNWAQLLPHIQPVAFTTFSTGLLLDRARQHGWKIYPVPKTNEFATPFLKEMFFAVKDSIRSKFYGFCNADILFTDGLLRTVEAVSSNLDVLNTTLIIGRRTNVNVNPNDTKPIYKYQDIISRAKAAGRLFSLDAEDYFLLSNVPNFPWHKVKDVVIGRPGYDNYLLGTAILNNITTVDATNTILAFHQTGKDGNRAGSKNKDSTYNRRLIGRFNYNLGITSRALYDTHTDFRGKVYLHMRKQRKHL